MKTREPKPTGRKLKVRWSTEEWQPAIQFAQGQRNAQSRHGQANRGEVRAIQVVLDPALFENERSRRRKIQPVLWVRAGGRISPGGLNGSDGSNGSRSTWR